MQKARPPKLHSLFLLSSALTRCDWSVVCADLREIWFFFFFYFKNVDGCEMRETILSEMFSSVGGGRWNALDG